MNNIFYHMFCVNDCIERFDKTYHKIESSGLIGEVDSIRVNCVGSKKEECFSILNNYYKVIATIGLNHQSEAETINMARDFATKNIDGNILYLHSKGVKSFSKAY